MGVTGCPKVQVAVNKSSLLLKITQNTQALLLFTLIIKTETL
jgi:hypothetical protein